MVKIRKRDGRIKPYSPERIKNALYSAFEEVSSKECYLANIGILMKLIEEGISSHKEDIVDIEVIQELSIEALKEIGLKNVAIAFDNYRRERERVRSTKLSLIKEIEGLVDNTNIEVLTENSNKQSHLVSTQRDLIAGEVSKFLARTHMIPKHLIEANDRGEIKIHDMDYFLQPIYNCELVNLGDMLQNGTVINKKKIDKPKSLRTAMTLATQISAQVASVSYGGQTITLSHLAPFVRISRNKIEQKFRKMNLSLTEEELQKIIEEELKAEIRDSVQTFNYQVSTLMTVNGQSPFISVCMYISEDKEYEKETVMLIEEFLKQRIEGMKNEYDVIATQTFPKLLYFLDENNTYKDSEYFWLTELATKSVSVRMSPDFISVKKMKELTGYAFPCIK